MLTKPLPSVLLALGLLAASAGPASTYECSAALQAAYYKRMDTLFNSGILRYQSGRPGTVFVSEVYWRGLTFAQKTSFSEQLSCAVAGAEKSLASLTFLSEMTGKTVGEWRPGRLVVP